MSKEAMKTGSEPAVLVAIDQFFPPSERVLNDPLAYKFLPFWSKMLVSLFRFKILRKLMIKASEKSAPGLWGGMLCRKRYMDEKLMDFDAEAIVNLGAGLDTRLYRLSFDIPAFELDQPGSISYKQRVLAKVFSEPPKNIKLVSIDFDKQNLLDALESNGCLLEKKIFFIWEAVTQYLTQDGINATFDFLSQAKSGSVIALTYVRKKFIDGEDLYHWPAGYKRFVKKKIWIFGKEPEDWPPLLEKYGWQMIEDVDYETLAEKYISPTGRNLLATPVERMIYAEKI